MKNGALLVSNPLLNDGFFNRSVVLIINHNDEGTFGFVLNKQTQFKLRDVRPQIKNGNYFVYDGGPVGRDQLFFIHTLGDKIPNAMHIKGDLYFGGDFEQLLHLLEHDEISPNQLRLFVGYSGWTPGQLENEQKIESWFINEKFDRKLLHHDQSDLYRIKLEEEKKSLGIFANIGFDPSLN